MEMRCQYVPTVETLVSKYTLHELINIRVIKKLDNSLSKSERDRWLLHLNEAIKVLE